LFLSSVVMRSLLPFLCVVFFSSVLLKVAAQNVYSWNPEGGDGVWTNSSRWSQPGFPNSPDAVAIVDVDFGIGMIDVNSSVTVSKLVLGPGCSRLQITESSTGSVRLTVQTNPLDTATVTITGTVLNEPISISLGDPFITGRSALVTVRTELGSEVKTFQLNRPSSTDGWFYGTFDTVQGSACPLDPTILCVSAPQDIIVSYVAPLTGQTHNASFDIACADFSEFTVSEVEWMLISDSTQHNYDKLTDLKARLNNIRGTLNSRSYADNINHYKAVAQQSFLLGSTCFENYCASSSELLHKLSMDGGQIVDHDPAPFARLNPEDQH